DATGTATLTTAALGVGQHTLSARFHGSRDATSGAVALTVRKATTATTLQASATAVGIGQPVTFTARVTPTTGGVPSGAVTFKEGATVLGTAQLDGTGRASFTTSRLAAGRHGVRAEYAGTTG